MEDKDRSNIGGSETKSLHPRENASFISTICFCWIIPIFMKGYKNDLNESDLYGPLESHKSRLVGDRLEEEWNKQLKSKNKPSLWKAIIRIYGKDIAMYGVVFIVMELIVKMAQPIFLGKLMEYYDPTITEVTRNWAIFYATMIPLFSFINVLIVHSYVFGLMHLGMKIRVAACSLIYRKALRLSKSALAETTVGQMVNLLSNDVTRFDYALIHFHNLWLAPIETLIIMYLLYNMLGVTATAGIAILLLFIPLQLYLSKKTSTYRMRIAIKTDSRVRLMNEIINGIQVIKMYTWEIPFTKLVAHARKLEIHEIKYAAYLRAINFSFMLFLSRTSVYFCVLAYVLSGNALNAGYVYVITSFYGNLRQALTMFLPQGLTFLAESHVSVKRIQHFLMYDEIEKDKRIVLIDLSKNGKLNKKLENGNSEPISIDETYTPNIEIILKDVSVKWSKSSSEDVLKNVNIHVKSKELIAIVGQVGSGKTTLLHVILKELIPHIGNSMVEGRISYASQEPWLFAGSIRQNILFGQPMDAVRYHKVITVCALERDFKLLPYGDRTLIGERGVMLSGGQKARINLARAVYKDADIYLLDDPLSAVDTEVGKQLFDWCIINFLKDKCVVLVTHQLQYLRNVDKIYLLKNGTIQDSGTYEDLLNSNDEYLKLLQTDTNDEDEVEKIYSVKSQKSLESVEDLPVEVQEQRSFGTIKKKVYDSYIQAGGSWFITILLILCFVISQLAAVSCDYFLTYWVNEEQDKLTNKSLALSDELTIYFEIEYDGSHSTYLYIYTTLIVSVITLTFTRSLSFFKFCLTASIRLHNKMFAHVVYATMRFFNTNPSGRILNRFSKDMGSIDEILPLTAIDTFQIGLAAFSITLLIALVNPWSIILTIVIFSLFYWYRTVYLATSRDLKRIEGTARSPVFNHLTASLQGLTTIRAFGAEKLLMNEFDNHQDLHSSAFYLFMAGSRAFGFFLDLNCVVYITVVTLSFLFISFGDYGGNVGLAITQSMVLTGMLQWGMRQWSELENQMTSVERIVEYTELPSEPKIEKLPPVGWPFEGNIIFEDMSLRYVKDEAYVLKNLNFEIKAKEKIGIVGRTGAGKSSIIAALFRLCPIEGKIIIDEVDTNLLNLQSFRSKISIIPQEPMLFNGTLRQNLDPFEEFSDEVIWSALEEVELKQLVADSPLGFQSVVSESGSNFSVGQRQLICLARAIIRNNKMLVMDEATANVDPKTDELIQKTIRRKFKDCTVLTIAHRLHTVMDSDRILVMDAGRVMEFDHPYVLLQNENGVLTSLVKQTGRGMAENLQAIAKANYHKDEL